MIYYLTHYISDSESKLKYCISPAGQNKSAYFADILSKSDLDYEIVSWAEVDSDQGFFHSTNIPLGNNGRYRTLSLYIVPRIRMSSPQYIRPLMYS